MTVIEHFLSSTPSVESCWRGIILYGYNTGSYKFALASTLLEIEQESGQLITLEDIAPSFATTIASHLTLLGSIDLALDPERLSRLLDRLLR